MLRTFTLALVVTAIVASHSDAHAMARKGKHRAEGEQTETVATFSLREFSSEPVSSVPEVGTLVLLVSGVAGLALWTRRRK